MKRKLFTIVGVLYGTTREEMNRVRMMDTIAPFWDGNETWLVVIGAGLFAAFPDVYAVFLGAFYLPVLLLLLGLIFRGVAFEFRFRSKRMMQAFVAQQIAGFAKFPPRQKPASFNLDAVLAQVSGHGHS